MRRRLALFLVVSLVLLSLPMEVMGQNEVNEAAGTEAVPFIVGTGDFDYQEGIYYDAGFRFPNGIVHNPHTNMLLIADTQNHRIRQMSLETFEVTSLAGTSSQVDQFGFPLGGHVDGPAEEAMFRRPRGMVVAPNGAVYVADAGNHAIRQIYDGKVYTVAGSGKPGYEDGMALEAAFWSPTDMVIDSQGNLLVSDTMNHVIRKIDQEGQVTTYAGEPGKPGIFFEPMGLSIDNNDVLYVADSANHQIKVIDKYGIIRVLAGTSDKKNETTGYLQGGYENGLADEARFNSPRSIAQGSDGVVYVADAMNHSIRAITPSGDVYTMAGSGKSGSQWSETYITAFDGPSGIVFAAGYLFVTDYWNNRLVAIPALPAYLGPISDMHQSQGVIPVYVDGKEMTFPDVAPFIADDGRVRVPLRSILNEWGADLTWDGMNRRVTVAIDEQVITLSEGDEDFSIVGGRSVVTLKTVAEKLGYSIQWKEDARAVVIETSTPQGRITSLTGDAWVIRAGGARHFEAQVNMGLMEGDQVITGRGAGAVITFADERMLTLTESTRIYLSELRGTGKGQHSAAVLYAGGVASRIKNPLTDNSRFEIRTPTAVIGARGTEFFTSYNNGEIDVRVITGAVGVSASIGSQPPSPPTPSPPAPPTGPLAPPTSPHPPAPPTRPVMPPVPPPPPAPGVPSGPGGTVSFTIEAMQQVRFTEQSAPEQLLAPPQPLSLDGLDVTFIDRVQEIAQGQPELIPDSIRNTIPEARQQAEDRSQQQDNNPYLAPDEFTEGMNNTQNRQIIQTVPSTFSPPPPPPVPPPAPPAPASTGSDRDDDRDSGGDNDGPSTPEPQTPELPDIELAIISDDIVDSNTINLHTFNKSTAQITVQVDPDDVNLTITSNNLSIITVSEVTENSAEIIAVGYGDTTITVIAEKEGFKTGTTIVTVKVEAPTIEFTVAPANIQIHMSPNLVLPAQISEQISLEFSPSEDVSITFDSESIIGENVATFDEDTVLITVKGLGVTKIIITASKSHYQDAIVEIIVEVIEAIPTQ